MREAPLRRTVYSREVSLVPVRQIDQRIILQRGRVRLLVQDH
jgi:hypothetical protein